jgi:hypothetical protein
MLSKIWERIAGQLSHIVGARDSTTKMDEEGRWTFEPEVVKRDKKGGPETREVYVPARNRVLIAEES